MNFYEFLYLIWITVNALLSSPGEGGGLITFRPSRGGTYRRVGGGGGLFKT